MATLSNKEEIAVGDTLYIKYVGKIVPLTFFSDRGAEIWIKHHKLKKKIQAFR